MILPNHFQHWPDTLLPHRLEEYVVDDGSPPTWNRRAVGKFVTGQQVVDAVAAAQAKTGLANIDPRYYVGTAMHEAGVTNEWDTEVATVSCPSGYVSVGLYQIGDEEARSFGFTLEDMLDLDKCTECMVRLAEKHRADIRAFMASQPPQAPGYLAADAPDPDFHDQNGVTWPGGTMRAYLAYAHNAGFGAARASIMRYGMNWQDFKMRNSQANIVCHGYGDDVITGGSAWPGASIAPWPPRRVLMLTVPPMRGEDVAVLQRKLGVSDDGVFGPATDGALRQLQHDHGLVADGKLGPATLSVLQALP